MKIIICGVGRVGLAIASYLSLQKNNDITVVDTSPQLVKQMSNTYDVHGVVGHASQPDILKKAGAESADIIIAVTDCDEVNMVACQVAHSVFGISKKIARIRNQEYRDVAWSDLFSRNHMPIDVIISPEEEIAEAIIKRMSVPGTTNDLSLADDKVHISGLIIHEDNKIVDDRIQDIYLAHRDLDFHIFMLFRNGKPLIWDDDTTLQSGDEILFLCAQTCLFTLLDRLGNNNNIYTGGIVVCGGGVIGESLCHKIKNNTAFSKNDLTVIENDVKRARDIHQRLNDVLVIHGSALDYGILEEVNTSQSSLFVSVMNSNENNILSAVLAKKMGSQYAIALSTNKLYNQLLPDRFIDAIVDPETITVSRILHKLQRGYIRAIHTIRDTGVEIIEAEVTDQCGIVHIPICEMNLNKKIKILGLYRNDDDTVIIPKKKTVIKSGDRVVLLADNVPSAEVEKLFSFSINLF